MTTTVQPDDLTQYQTKAEQGDAEAQYQLGLCYAQGNGVEKNFRESARLWLLAGKQNHSKALVYLGKLFEKGAGVPQDYTKAMQCYQTASNQDLAEAKVHLAMLYMQGLGVEQDIKKAVNLFIQSAEQGEPIAQYNLGIAYEKGLGGFTKNTELAIFWYTQAANQNHEAAIKRLAQIESSENPDNSENTVENTAENTAENTEDNGEQAFHKGVEKLETNVAEAVELFAQSASQNYAKAQYNMGLAHLFAIANTEQNTELAIDYLQKAAEQDFRPAHFVLGWLYQGGFDNRKTFDQEKSLLHYEKASELGHAQAQYFLFNMYQTGNGVTQNDETALTWLRQSAKQGYGLAYQRLEQLVP